MSAIVKGFENVSPDDFIDIIPTTGKLNKKGSKKGSKKKGSKKKEVKKKEVKKKEVKKKEVKKESKN